MILTVFNKEFQKTKHKANSYYNDKNKFISKNIGNFFNKSFFRLPMLQIQPCNLNNTRKSIVFVIS